MLSILTPSYNYGRFIEDAIKSVLFLELDDVEMVIQDGASTDDTVATLRKYESETVRWVSEADTGQPNALNKAFSRSNGDWIGWLNADEFYLPGGVQALIEAGERSGADVVFGDSIFVDVNGGVLRALPQHVFSHWVLRWYGCFILTASLVLRRSALGKNPWDEGLRAVSDWELFLRLASEGARFVHVARPVGAFRVHPDRITADPNVLRDDFPIVRNRYGLPGSPLARPLGRGVHGFLKLARGAYKRQAAVRRFRGRDIRWFADAHLRRGLDDLIQKSYGRRPP